MPTQYDLPEFTNAASIEDVNKYNKLPFYLASLEAKYFAEWQVYNQLYGTLPWQANQGKTIRGVRAEPTPLGQQEFYPEELDHIPNKNVYETLETTEDATLKMHDFDSKQFHFLPSFQDFRENQIDFNHKDIVRQIANSNDIFIRSVMLQKSPYVFIAGNTAGDQLQSAPFIPSGTAMSSANVAALGKNAAYFTAIMPTIGSNLSLAVLDYAVAVFRDDIAAPFFEGTVNTPRDNELIKGKYVLICDSEAYQMFKWDPNFAQFRNVNLAIITEGFRGSIFDELTAKIERWPLRIARDGTFPAQQVVDLANNRTRPNPAYNACQVGVAWLLGADAYKTLKVGPPPRAFATKAMSKEKFYSLNWNGEVILTDQVLVRYADGTYDTNVRGRFLKLISSVIYGAIPVNSYNCLPIFYNRRRPAVV